VTGAQDLYANPLFGVAVTVLAYVLAQAIHLRWRCIHPLLVTCGLLIALLLLARVPYEKYRVGGDLVSFFLGPATIALGVPFYKQSQKIRPHAGAVVVAVAIGSACGIASAAAFVWALGGAGSVLRSMLPKSVTTPIAIELSRQLGGTPELTAVFTVLAGLTGSVVGPWLLRRAGVRNDLAVGLAMGTSSHGIGTARVVRESDLQGGASGFAMALAGIVTSLMTVPLQWWLK
jgi:predicted murein hydrolase (TIGR00659 family)